MKGIFWFVVCLFVAVAGGIPWYIRRKFKERQRAEEERVASFLAATAGNAKSPEAPPAPAAAPPPPAGDGLAQQKLLFEAAHKAGDAGEPALAIQLYARLLARYPASGFAGQAHAAVDAQKKKLAKG
jgi:hypothetical protein